MQTVAKALKGHPSIIEHYKETRASLTRNTDPLHEIEVTAEDCSGGFTWGPSVDGHNFWEKILIYKDFDVFYNKYPQSKLKPVTELDSLLDQLGVKTLEVNK